MKGVFPNKVLARPVSAFIGVSLLLVVSFDYALPDTVDTLNLQLQWAYPIGIADMKLVDFNNDGINEILVGFKSDSSRVGILDAVSQTMVWQSPAFHGSIYTVAAGDRNNDGYIDIVCGGQRSDSAVGCIEVFDGPTFDSVYSASGFDKVVLSAGISNQFSDSVPQIFLGTHYDSTFTQPLRLFMEEYGKLYILDAQNLTIEVVNTYGTISEVLLRDINNDTYEELFVGMDYAITWEDYHGPDGTWIKCWINSSNSFDSCTYYLYNEFWPMESFVPAIINGLVWFDALEVGRFNNYTYSSIIGSSHVRCHYMTQDRAKLACWNASSTQLQWSKEWFDEGGHYATDLTVCNLYSYDTNTICVAYYNGLIEFISGSDASLLAVSPRQHTISRMKLGNVDNDNFVEICMMSGDSLYIYETSAITTGIAETEDFIFPENFFLFPNYPNPFNPETNIRFTIPIASEVILKIYNVLGEEVRGFQRHFDAGTHTFTWDGKSSFGEDVSSGVYLYQLSAGNYHETRKMVLIK